MSLVSTTLTSSSLKGRQPGSFDCFENAYSLATAAHRPSGERAMSRMGSVHRVSIFSKEQVSNEYWLTAPSSEPTMKKSFCSLVSKLVTWSTDCTYSSSNCQVVVRTVIDILRFSIRPSSVYPYDIIGSRGDQLFPVRCIGQRGGPCRICMKLVSRVALWLSENEGLRAGRPRTLVCVTVVISSMRIAHCCWQA